MNAAELALQAKEVPLLTADNVKRVESSYKPSFDFGTRYINDFHRLLGELPADERGKVAFPFNEASAIPGNNKQARINADMLKIYELAYCSPGNVIDLGTATGRSAYISSRAITDAGRRDKVFTIDINEGSQQVARKNLAGHSHTENVTFILESGHLFLKRCISNGTTAGFVFVDHCHEFLETALSCAMLDLILPVGGFALFHDYNDRRNFDDAILEYDVIKGIKGGLDLKKFKKIAVNGSTALFVRHI